MRQKFNVREAIRIAEWFRVLKYAKSVQERRYENMTSHTEKNGETRQDFDARNFVLSLLRQSTSRDEQKLIGPSQLSNGCSRCLAEEMLGTAENNSPYFLGAVVGTAIHALVEDRGQDIDGWLPETKVTIGTIEGYGTVKGTSDGYHIPSGTVVDIKTTDREKLGFIKRAIIDPPSEYEVTKVAEARFKVANYFRQTQLYGLGVENAGYEPQSCALVFICRDGKIDKDIWAHTIPYDREEALRVFDRAGRLFAWLQDGHTPEELASHPVCYRCIRREE